MGNIVTVAVSSVLKRICVNGRYRTRTCDLTGVMHLSILVIRPKTHINHFNLHHMVRFLRIIFIRRCEYVTRL